MCVVVGLVVELAVVSIVDGDVLVDVIELAVVSLVDGELLGLVVVALVDTVWGLVVLVVMWRLVLVASPPQPVSTIDAAARTAMMLAILGRKHICIAKSSGL